MRLTQPSTTGQDVQYSIVKIQGCTDLTLGFDILNQEPRVSKRRYCNKVLVHECVTVPVSDPLPLVKAELMATDDPCYSLFNIFKSSEIVDEVPASITLQLDDADLVIGLIVDFVKTDTCCLPLRMAYRLYGYYADGTRILLSNGNMYVTPCSCESGSASVGGDGGCGEDYWTSVSW
jgi:hypothetical protein